MVSNFFYKESLSAKTNNVSNDTFPLFARPGQAQFMTILLLLKENICAKLF